MITEEVKEELTTTMRLSLSNRTKLTYTEKKLRDLEVEAVKTNDTLDCLDKRVGNVENKLENVENRLDKVENKLENVENKVNNLETDMSEVKSKLNDLELKVGNVDNKLDAIFSFLKSAPKG
jgi:chromosome segregation ATPase